MDASGTWACPACGATNAAYRRRCLDCGGRRTSILDDEPRDGEAAPAGRPFAAADVPMPALARRRMGSGRRWPATIAALAVLAFAAYGLATYVRADRPSVAAQEAALLDALPAGADPTTAEITRMAGEPPGEGTELVGCPSIDDRIVDLLNEHGVVAVLSAAGPGERVTHLVAFDSNRAAIRYDELVAEALVDGCLERPCCVSAGIEGRVWVSTEGPQADADLFEVFARLDLPG